MSEKDIVTAARRKSLIQYNRDSRFPWYVQTTNTPEARANDKSKTRNNGNHEVKLATSLSETLPLSMDESN